MVDGAGNEEEEYCMLPTVVGDKMEDEEMVRVVPEIESGGSMRAVYMEEIGKDESLTKQREFARQRVKGFLWKEGILK